MLKFITYCHTFTALIRHSFQESLKKISIIVVKKLTCASVVLLTVGAALLYGIKLIIVTATNPILYRNLTFLLLGIILCVVCFWIWPIL